MLLSNSMKVNVPVWIEHLSIHNANFTFGYSKLKMVFENYRKVRFGFRMMLQTSSCDF